MPIAREETQKVLSMMDMFFSDRTGLLVDFQARNLQVKEDRMAPACSAAIDLILDAPERYDRECKFMPDYSGYIADRDFRRSGGRERLAFLLYFLTACVREVTMSSSEMTVKERDVLNGFRKPEIAQDPAWDGWYHFYEDFIFNLLPLREANHQLVGIAQRRDEIAQLESRIRGEAAAMAELSNELKSQMLTAAEEKKRVLLGELDSIEGRIDGYRDELKKHATNYNFVGLSNAFKELIKSKSYEIKRYGIGVGSMGAMALAAPITAAVLLKDGVFGWSASSAWSVLATMKFVGLVGIEVVLLYYFRITLKSFLLAKDQHANLSLRLALCQFIEGYCDFSEKTKDKGISVMKGFEDLIFSPLPANDKALPPTIDGIDGFVNIVAALKQGK